MKKFVDLQLTASPPPTHTNTGSFNRLKKMTRTSVIRGGNSKIVFFDFSKKYAESQKVFKTKHLFFMENTMEYYLSE